MRELCRLAALFLEAALAVVFSASVASAQRDTAVPIQFDFINPGARSLGLAGAFTGVANDATAAATNPAGLTQLLSSEASIEVRGWHYVTPFVRGGRVEGPLTNRGIDTIASLDVAETTTNVVGPSFLSYVHRLRNTRGHEVNIAGYRQEVSRLRARARSQGFFFRRVGDPEDHRELPFQVDRQIDVVNYGIALGVNLGTQFSIGGGIQAANMAIVSLLRSYEYPEPGGVRDLYAPADYRELLYEGHQIGDDWSPTFNVGVMWSPGGPTARVRAGGTYRRGAKFKYEGSARYPERLGRAGQARANSDYQGDFRVPDVSALGVSVRPTTELLVAAEFSHVRYSQLLTFIRSSVIFPSADPTRYDIPNSNEWHVGAEYVFARRPSRPIIRGGIWRDPNHALTYGGTDEVWKVLPPGKSMTHYSLGAGIAPGTIEIHAAADISSRPIVFAVSATLRFPRSGE